VRLAAIFAALGGIFLLAGCADSNPKAIPDVSGATLDVAEAELAAADLHFSVVGGGTFGVIVRSHWQVCRQSPKPGAVAKNVTLTVARSCDEDSSGRAAVIPDVEYEPLDVAEADLAQAGLGWEVESDYPIVVRSHWQVCDQDPEPGQRATSVELYVDRSCGDWGW
jgi:beta-lactam-binding protein with PASTA domain